jgi:hypothetical protein
MSKNSYPKLALCLSGQPRSYFEGHSYIKKNLLDHFDTDVFIHSWKNENHLQQLKIYEDLNAIYSPVVAVYEKALSEQTNSDMFVPNASHPAHFCTSMFYSIFRADSFRTFSELFNEKKYDFVIRCRFDFALNTLIDFTKLEKNKVYISKDTDGSNPLLNDQFAIADSETMKIYSSAFLFLRYHHNRAVHLCGHAMLEAQLDMFKVHVKRIDMNHPFEDGKYNIGRHSIIRDDMSKWVNTKLWGY